MLEAGQIFAHFRILEKLGEGGMGAVFLAEDQKLHRRVALKVLPPEFIEDVERAERFRREARTAASISHSNVTSIHDLGETTHPVTGRPTAYIVMEYVAGQPLNRYLQEHTLEMVEVLRIAEKIASGLAAAHKLGIVHRDIKPENVIITEEGEPKILDFGLAKAADAPFQSDADEKSDDDVTVTLSGDLTQVGKIVGTVNYMSPEQAQGEPLDTRSDIFSFGVLLYRLATGEAPFSGPTQVSTLAKIIEGSHEPAHARNAKVDPGLERIIDTCLKKNPADRYQETPALVADLRELRRQYDSGMSDSSLSRTGVHAAAPAGKPNRTPLLAGIGALVVLVAIAGFALRGGAGPETADAAGNSVAVVHFENATGDPEFDWMETGLPEILVTDLTRCEGLLVLSSDRVEDELRRDRGDERPSHADWVRASEKLGARAVISGSFQKAGDQIQITAKMEDVKTGQVVFAQRVRGRDAFALVDSLSSLVTAELHIDVPMGDSSVRELTTASQEAYKAYHLGGEALLTGRMDEALAQFERAIAADSSFALPYMRIGMVHQFEGRLQQSVPWFVKAKEREAALPERDRRLLDVYYDIWVTRQFDDSLRNMETLVAEYPEDKEARTILGALISGLGADTTRAFAEFERVLELDPEYPLALEIYSENLQQFKEFPRAIALMKRYVKAHPDAPSGYENLGDLYEAIGDNERAMGIYEEFRERFPGNPAILNDMYSVAVRLRDFEDARRYTEEMLQLKPNDFAVRLRYASQMSNLAMWVGRFQAVDSRYRDMLTLAKAERDTLQIFSLYMSYSGFRNLLDDVEGAVEAMREAHPYAPTTNGMQYPAGAVSLKPEMYEEMLPVYREAANRFKASVPENLWPMADAVGDAMKAFAARDTAAIIEYYEATLARPEAGAVNVGISWVLGTYLQKSGKAAEAIPHLENGRLAGAASVPTSSAHRYLDTTYRLGAAHEALGQADEAIEFYREVLRYWGDADRDIEAARESRAGLNRLTS